MKIARGFKLILFIMSLSCFFSPVTGKEIRVVFANDYLPFSWQENNQVKGILKDYLDEILVHRMGIDVSYEICPWARCQLMVKEGLRDAFFTISSGERDTYSTRTMRPVFISNFYIYSGANNKNLGVLKEVKSLQSLLKLETLRHIYILGGGWHRQNIAAAHNVTTVVNSTKILELLKLNRADVYIEQAALMNYQIKQMQLQKEIIQIPTVMDQTNWHLYISNKSDFLPLLIDIDSVLAEMDKSGTLQKLHDKLFAKYQ